MQKTRLGVGVGLVAAAMYFIGLFGGYLAAIVLAGYVLLFEEDEWLKKTVVKVVSLMVLFSVLTGIINLIPDMMDCLSNFIKGFYGFLVVGILSRTTTLAVIILDIIRTLLFIVLGFMALHQKTIAMPLIDKMINKYMMK